MKPVPEHVPAVGALPAVKIPEPSERTLRNGLRIIAVRKPGIPRVEIRLRVAAGTVHDGGDASRARVLPEVLLSGTATRDAVGIQRELQELGANLGANLDADDVIIAGGTLVASVDAFFSLVADVVRAPSFPAEEVAIARDRVAQEIVIALSQPQAIATLNLRRALFGKHRYARGFPSPTAIRRLGRAPIERYHDERFSPRGATLVIVGDLRPADALDRAEAAFGSWKGSRPAAAEPPAALRAGAQPIRFIDRPGAVQTNIRLGGAAVSRAHDDWFKLALANMVFGGYFSSRLTNNIREDKGYTYSPGSSFEHRKMVSTFFLAADVGTTVTAPALVEILYELGRIATVPVAQEELDAARRYLGGVTMLQIQTQAGLAGMLDSLVAAGLGIDYLRALRRRLDEVTIEGLTEAAARYLAPARLSTVMVGDASIAAPPVEALAPLEVLPATDTV